MWWNTDGTELLKVFVLVAKVELGNMLWTDQYDDGGVGQADVVGVDSDAMAG